MNANSQTPIKDGRYLGTHTHNDETLTAMSQHGYPEGLITINIFNSNGELILQIPGRAIGTGH